jgi:hypothetical protein
MKSHPIRSAAGLAVLVWLSANAVIAEAPKKTPMSPLQSQMMQKMKDAAPGVAQKALGSLEGSWKTEQKIWLEPGQPTVTQGTCENRFVSGGRLLEQRMHGTLMNEPYEELGLTGYDGRKNIYVTLWGDPRTNTIETYEGAADTAARELSVLGTGHGPDGKAAEVKLVTRWVDPERHMVSTYIVRDGNEELMMETLYRRIAL